MSFVSETEHFDLFLRLEIVMNWFPLTEKIFRARMPLIQDGKLIILFLGLYICLSVGIWAVNWQQC